MLSAGDTAAAARAGVAEGAKDCQAAAEAGEKVDPKHATSCTASQTIRRLSHAECFFTQDAAHVGTHVSAAACG